MRKRFAIAFKVVKGHVGRRAFAALGQACFGRTTIRDEKGPGKAFNEDHSNTMNKRGVDMHSQHITSGSEHCQLSWAHRLTSEAGTLRGALQHQVDHPSGGIGEDITCRHAASP